MLEFPKNKDIINSGAIIFRAYEYNFVDIVVEDIAIKKGKGLGSVRLYIPSGISEDYGISYNNENVSILAQTVKSKNITAGAKTLINKAIQELQQKVGKPYTQIAGKGLFPNSINIFQSSNIYNVSYTFNFIPRNKDEADTMMKIVDFFKRMALPVDLASDDAFLKLAFPAIFDITIRSKIIDNKKISTKNNNVVIKEYYYMVLNNVSINYVPNGDSWMSFDDGKPVSINLSLSFMGISPPRIRGDRMTGQII